MADFAQEVTELVHDLDEDFFGIVADDAWQAFMDKLDDCYEECDLSPLAEDLPDESECDSGEYMNLEDARNEAKDKVLDIWVKFKEAEITEDGKLKPQDPSLRAFYELGVRWAERERQEKEKEGEQAQEPELTLDDLVDLGMHPRPSFENGFEEVELSPEIVRERGLLPESLSDTIAIPFFYRCIEHDDKEYICFDMQRPLDDYNDFLDTFSEVFEVELDGYGVLNRVESEYDAHFADNCVPVKDWLLGNPQNLSRVFFSNCTRDYSLAEDQFVVAQNRFKPFYLDEEGIEYCMNSIIHHEAGMRDLAPELNSYSLEAPIIELYRAPTKEQLMVEMAHNDVFMSYAEPPVAMAETFFTFKEPFICKDFWDVADYVCATGFGCEIDDVYYDTIIYPDAEDAFVSCLAQRMVQKNYVYRKVLCDMEVQEDGTLGVGSYTITMASNYNPIDRYHGRPIRRGRLTRLYDKWFGTAEY